MGQGRKPVPFPKGKYTKAQIEDRKGPGYSVAYGSKPPAHFNAWAKAEWKRVVPELERLSIVKQVSVASIVGLCSAFGTAMEAERAIKKHGLISEIPVMVDGKPVKGENGKPLIAKLETNPAVRIARDAWAQYKSFAAECCVTPASENKAPKVGAEKQMDDLEAALCA